MNSQTACPKERFKLVDINARPDQSPCASNTLQRAFRLTVDVVSGKPCVRNLIVAALLESHQCIVQIDQALFREISIKCRADIVCIQSHPLSAAVVVHNDLYKIRIIREL